MQSCCVKRIDEQQSGLSSDECGDFCKYVSARLSHNILRLRLKLNSSDSDRFDTSGTEKPQSRSPKATQNPISATEEILNQGELLEMQNSFVPPPPSSFFRGRRATSRSCMLR